MAKAQAQQTVQLSAQERLAQARASALVQRAPSAAPEVTLAERVGKTAFAATSFFGDVSAVYKMERARRDMATAEALKRITG